MTVPGNLSSPLLATAAAAAAAGPIKSLRFNSADSAYLSGSGFANSDTKTMTFSFWLKRSASTTVKATQYVFSGGDNGTIFFDNGTSDQLTFNLRGTSGTNFFTHTEAVLRDFSAWYHIVVALDLDNSTTSERFKCYINGVQQTMSSTGYPNNNFHDGGTWYIGSYTGTQNYPDFYLADFYHIAGLALDPTSFGAYDDNGVWQAAVYSGTFGTNGFHLLDFANEATIGHDSSGNENDFTANNISSGFTAGKLYKSSTLYTTKSDVTANATLISNGASLSSEYLYYVPTGSEPAGAKAFDAPGEETATGVIDFYYHTGSAWVDVAGAYNDGEIADFTFGSDSNFYQLTKSRDFYVIGSNLGNDGSGLPPNAFSGTAPAVSSGGANQDVLFDVPTNGTQSGTGEVSGNYCTWNPLALQSSGHGGLRQGNLEIIADTAGSHKGTLATFAIPSSGKWYWEVKAFRTAVNGGGAVGVAEASAIASTASSGTRLGEANSSSWVLSLNSFDAVHTNTVDYADYLNGGTVVADTGIIGIAVDMDNDKMWMHYNGTYGNAGGTGNPATGANPMFSGEFSGLTIFPAAGISVDSGSGYITANWGQRSFSYSAPSGFKALCTTNLPTPTIADGSDYFQTVLWSGSGSARSITTTGMSPDWVWIKPRNAAYNNALFDTVRGSGKRLKSNDTVAEDTDNNTLSGFNSDGFSLGTNNGVNQSSKTYVAWCWDGGSSTVSNTDGSITSNVRANPSAGFSIVTYTGSSSGSTVGHGLNAAPEFIIGKRRDGTSEWSCYHKSLGNNQAIILNTTAAAGSSSTWNSTTPSSSVVTLGSAHSVNFSSYTHVLYCFAPVEGYSAFGKTVGNNSTSGPFVYTGFRPRFIIWRPTSSGHSWMLIDTARDTYNVADATLRAQNANAESHFDWGDVLSNGFKIRNTDTNPNNVDIVYAAWAENPFQANGGLAR